MPDNFTIKLSQNTLNRIIEGIARPIKKTRTFFTLLGTRIDQDTQLMFQGEGVRPGVNSSGWQPFSPNTLKTPAGRYRIRYGTDLRPKYPGWKDIPRYKTGEKRGQIIPHRRRRYSASSKLLQASGGFRKSFKRLEITPRKLLYGSQLAIGEKILDTKKKRRVVVITGTDEWRYARIFQQWYDRNFTI